MVILYDWGFFCKRKITFLSFPVVIESLLLCDVFHLRIKMIKVYGSIPLLAFKNIFLFIKLAKCNIIHV